MTRKKSNEMVMTIIIIMKVIKIKTRAGKKISINDKQMFTYVAPIKSVC